MIQMTLTPQLSPAIIGARHERVRGCSRTTCEPVARGPVADVVTHAFSGVAIHPVAAGHMAYLGMGNGTGVTNCTGTKRFTSTKWTTRLLGVMTT